MTVFLHGLRLKNYRGIGNDFVELAPLKKMNFLIGQNDSGKSIFLDFVDLYIAKDGQRFKPSIFSDISTSETERHGVTTEFLAEISYCLKLDEFLANARNSIRNYALAGIEYEKLFRAMKDSLDSEGYFWRVLKNHGNRTISIEIEPEQLTSLIDRAKGINWNEIALHHTSTGWNDESLNANHLINWFENLVRLNFSTVTKIEALRKADATQMEIGNELPPFKMEFLTNIVHTIEKAEFNQPQYKELYKKLNIALDQVFPDKKYLVKATRDGKKLVISRDGFELPLLNVGKGIEDVLVILTASVCYSNQVICIEEPELNLHPLIQRRLIKYLSEHTENQYIISTHSPTIIDAAEGSVFEVTHDGIQTRLRYVEFDSEKRAICEDLGCKASDLLQANCVIWVEGPSDRIYLNHWIRGKDVGLVEGIHYSIMFYGGKLINNLTALGESVESDYLDELIDLIPINRNLAILMDRDTNDAQTQIRASKLEFEKALNNSNANSFCWVTQGREIENYLDFDELHKCLKSLYESSYHSPVEINEFGHALHFFVKDKDGNIKMDIDGNGVIKKDSNKNAIARIICESEPRYDILDLDQKIQGLVQFIKKSNLME